MCFTRGLFRLALIGGLVAGGTLLLVDRDSLAAAFAQVRGKVQGAVDSMIDDPVALRRQLQSLSEQYPEKIAEVRAELSEVERQIAQLAKDTDVAQHVVAATTRDLTDLQELLARADAATATGQVVQVRFNATRLDVPAAKQEFRRIASIRQTYQDRVKSNERDLGYLGQQKSRLADILGRLEAEYTDFEAQMWQLDRKIDAIARNERLVEMIEERQETLDNLGRYEVASLDQLRGKLDEWEKRTEAELAVLERRFAANDYERDARFEIESEVEEFDIFDFDVEPESDENVKEIGADSGKVALNSDTIIE
jgi:chromosome segregation ATPase